MGKPCAVPKRSVRSERRGKPLGSILFFGCVSLQVPGKKAEKVGGPCVGEVGVENKGVDILSCFIVLDILEFLLEKVLYHLFLGFRLPAYPAP